MSVCNVDSVILHYFIETCSELKIIKHTTETGRFSVYCIPTSNQQIFLYVVKVKINNIYVNNTICYNKSNK